MKIVAECLGMCSDRPGITPNTLDLEVSPTCWRETGRELLGGLGRVGGRRKGLGHISPRVAGPTILRRRGPSATSRRTVRLYNFGHNTASGTILLNTGGLSRTFGGPSVLCSEDIPPVYPKPTGCTDDLRTVRGPLVDRRPYIFRLKQLSAEPVVTNPINGGPSASYLRTVRSIKILTTLNFANFHHFNFKLGSLII